MTTDLSPVMAEALRRCRESGGLVYVRGGFWIEATQDPLHLGARPRLFGAKPIPWSTTTHTIKALVKRGVVRETGREAYPTRVEAT